MTTIYLIRQSQQFRNLLGEYFSNEDEQLRNEKNPLSVNGEKLAKQMSEKTELKNIDVIYSSHYVRAMCTAKYIAENNNIKLNVDKRLSERNFGINNMPELPQTFFEDQFNDWNYKLKNGEFLNEVSARMSEIIVDVLNQNKDKVITIVSHGIAISTLLKNGVILSLTKIQN